MHHIISNILPPSHFLHDSHWLDYILSSVLLIDPGHVVVAVRVICHVHLHNPSAGFAPLLSADTHNIISRAAYYSVECLHSLFFCSPPGTYGAIMICTQLLGMIRRDLMAIRLCNMGRCSVSSLHSTLKIQFFEVLLPLERFLCRVDTNEILTSSQ